MDNELKAPFPWFGGKSKIAPIVWERFGDVKHYVEPFAGSLAVLLRRPLWHNRGLETVNDKDAYICNFWRALQHDPEGVAKYANYPANEADLMARHIWLVNTGAERVARLMGDPDYYDVQVAGWWVWGISLWIGGGWCDGRGPWTSIDGKLVKSGGVGVSKGLVHSGRGIGIHRKSLRDIVENRTEIDKKNILSLCGNGTGVDTGLTKLIEYFNCLAERLRYVRVACGSWERIVTRGALTHGSTVGIFLDPPYGFGLRGKGIYNTDRDGEDVTPAVYRWCLENQDNPRYRIALCGYEGEYDLPGWEKVAWAAHRSYGKPYKTANVDNRYKERILFSPNCIKQDEQNINS